MMRRDRPLGIVLHVEHRCRKKGMGTRRASRMPSFGSAPCAARRRSEGKLWPVAVPRHIRFHDLRHTTATLVLKAGVPLATVQRILRHSNPRLTSEIYGHLDVDDMRKWVDQRPICWTPPMVMQSPPAISNSKSFITRLSPGDLLRGWGRKTNPLKPLQFQGVTMVGPNGFEPSTSSVSRKRSTAELRAFERRGFLGPHRGGCQEQRGSELLSGTAGPGRESEGEVAVEPRREMRLLEEVHVVAHAQREQREQGNSTLSRKATSLKVPP